MIDIKEIDSEIEKLENGETTFAACGKLADLYIVREHLKGKKKSTAPEISNEVTTELGDILPRYRTYCDIKRRYQLHEVTEQPVILAMGDVCREIKEFIQTLYASTDMEEERKQLKQMIAGLQTII